MKETETSWSMTRAALARAKAADLDRQAREVERSATDGNWRTKARAREAAERLRRMAGRYLVKALKLEEGLDARLTQDLFE